MSEPFGSSSDKTLCLAVGGLRIRQLRCLPPYHAPLKMPHPSRHNSPSRDSQPPQILKFCSIKHPLLFERMVTLFTKMVKPFERTATLIKEIVSMFAKMATLFAKMATLFAKMASKL